MSKNFINLTRQAMIARCLAGDEIPMTVFNLTRNEEKNEEGVFHHEFSLREEVSPGSRMEIIQECILGSEWESAQQGLQNLCTIYSETRTRDKERCLIFHYKVEEQEIGELHIFEEKMTVGEDGRLKKSIEKTSCFVCDMNKTDLN